MMACCRGCPALELLQITGNDKVKGRIGGPALEELKATPALAPNLKELVLYDQNSYAKNFEKALKGLSKERKTLAIKTGDSLGDGMADNMIAAMTGGAMTNTWVGGKLIKIDVDGGIFGSGGLDMYDYGGFGNGFF
ncbi:hypothetical protein DXG03_005284 [Asterophora parasitica]|uniref:Uncharacterized protein n=1 Tax=Asterophora parasitica TaxID=117018 RepID=A0A9P7GEX1_9AGAR|nr:hypothetical protein DXG03_005284 [Asterophora parasitica]